MKQTKDELIILGTENLYFVNKKELISSAGLSEVLTENITEDYTINSIDGTVVLKDASEKDLEQLPKGIYICKGNKVIVK